MTCYRARYTSLLTYGKLRLNTRLVYYKKAYSTLKSAVWNTLCIVKATMTVRKMIFKQIMALIFL